ncbi:MAG TPA: hypothetical protein VLJ42_03585 [Solirubrobacteraceae bacterium]|nr:hypothetical protein [Solirubrobacteraceae bacterium]
MSTQTLTLAPDAQQLPSGAGAGAHAADTDTARTGKARAGMAMSLATFAMAAASGIQAVLYLSRFGTNVRTDGFFVAFALYSTFGVFSQSLRLTSVPLLVEPGARLSVRQFAAALAFVALPVLIVTIPLAGVLSQLIAPGLNAEGRDVTASALPVLGGAMALQLWAAGGATVLAIRDRFTTVAGAYMAGAGCGLVAFLALMGTAGEQTLGYSMFTMSVVTCAWMLLGVRVSGGFGAKAPRDELAAARDAARSGLSLKLAALMLALRTTVANTWLILGRTVIYLAFNGLFVITLAFASHASAGGTTMLSYGYLFASYLVAGTGMALGMSSIPDMTREARSQRLAVIAETVPRGFRYAMLIVAPALAGLIVAGAPLIHAVLPSSLSAADVHTLRVFTALLAPWTIAALLVAFLMPVLFALGRAGLLNALALPLVVLHLAATALGSALFGVDGAVGAFFVAPGCFAAILLVTGAGREGAPSLVRQLSGDTLRFLVLAALAFGAAWGVGEALPGGLEQAAAAGVLGCAVYGAGLWIVARRQIEVLLSAVAARPAAA